MPWTNGQESLHYIPQEITMPDGSKLYSTQITDEKLAEAGWRFEQEEIVQDPNIIKILMGDV
jgi:hypothetical protein